jgi:hypothetical protein
MILDGEGFISALWFFIWGTIFPTLFFISSVTLPAVALTGRFVA